MRFLVTAGNTREAIDQVRDWGNIFTGNTGFSIANALLKRGEVDLLSSNRQHLQQAANSSSLHGAAFTSHADLIARLDELMNKHKYDAIFMTAAVSDYRPGGVYTVVERATSGDEETWRVKSIASAKIRSTHPNIAVFGEPTEKIVDLFRTRWRHAGLLIKFKLEVGIDTETLIKIGQASRAASHADYLVANTLEIVTGPDAGAYLLSDSGAEWVPRAELAERMARLIPA